MRESNTRQGRVEGEERVLSASLLPDAMFCHALERSVFKFCLFSLWDNVKANLKTIFCSNF